LFVWEVCVMSTTYRHEKYIITMKRKLKYFFVKKYFIKVIHTYARNVIVFIFECTIIKLEKVHERIFYFKLLVALKIKNF